MQALEVGDLRLVAGLDEGLEPVHHQLRRATAQHGLLAEQVGLALLGEGRLDAAGAQATDRLGIGLGDVPGPTGGILLDADEDRDATAVVELAAHEVAGALGGDHDDVGARLGRDVTEPDVETVSEQQTRALLEVGLDLVGVDMALHLVGGEDDDEVGLLGRLGHRLDRQALRLGLGPALAALGEADAHVDPGVTQVERVGVALAAVADDGHLHPLDDAQVGVVVVDHVGHQRATP
ncbi:MAG: hypothetical protein BWY91_01426 [bacterium ADurb.BinA028]|nr:MAG: hypothetical protein BWY91_01426 [bacterium ADurb.BinA028]